MADAGTVLFLLLAAAVGFAVYFALRDFAAGLASGAREYKARVGDPRLKPGADASDNQKAERARSDTEPPAHISWYEVLQVHPYASLAEISSAYRRAIAQYHPDRVVGLGPELTFLAERRSKEINAAYREACRERRAAP